MSFNIRLKELVNHLDENPTSFASGLKTSSVETIRKLTKNENANPTLRTLLEILEKYPKISAEWLIKGTGTIEKSEGFHQEIFNGTDSGITELRKSFNSVLDELIMLRNENRRLKSR